MLSASFHTRCRFVQLLLVIPLHTLCHCYPSVAHGCRRYSMLSVHCQCPCFCTCRPRTVLDFPPLCCLLSARSHGHLCTALDCSVPFVIVVCALPVPFTPLVVSHRCPCPACALPTPSAITAPVPMLTVLSPSRLQLLLVSRCVGSLSSCGNGSGVAVYHTWHILEAESLS
jgi:hypothetical protein